MCREFNSWPWIFTHSLNCSILLAGKTLKPEVRRTSTFSDLGIHFVRELKELEQNLNINIVVNVIAHWQTVRRQNQYTTNGIDAKAQNTDRIHWKKIG